MITILGEIFTVEEDWRFKKNEEDEPIFDYYLYVIGSNKYIFTTEDFYEGLKMASKETGIPLEKVLKSKSYLYFDEEKDDIVEKMM